MDTLFIPLSLAAGALLAVQAGANAQLAKATCSPFVATTLQLAVGALLLLVFTVLSGTISALSLLPSAQWWHAIGGVASAFYVVAGILLFPRIGAVVSVGLFIAGQVLASAALDAAQYAAYRAWEEKQVRAFRERGLWSGGRRGRRSAQ